MLSLRISGDIRQVFMDNDETFLQHDTMTRLSRMVIPRYPHHITQLGVRSMNMFHEESEQKQPVTVDRMSM
jgi:hypothetical protein